MCFSVLANTSNFVRSIRLFFRFYLILLSETLYIHSSILRATYYSFNKPYCIRRQTCLSGPSIFISWLFVYVSTDSCFDPPVCQSVSISTMQVYPVRLFCICVRLMQTLKSPICLFLIGLRVFFFPSIFACGDMSVILSGRLSIIAFLSHRVRSNFLLVHSLNRLLVFFLLGLLTLFFRSS